MLLKVCLFSYMLLQLLYPLRAQEPKEGEENLEVKVVERDDDSITIEFGPVPGARLYTLKHGVLNTDTWAVTDRELVMIENGEGVVRYTMDRGEDDFVVINVRARDGEGRMHTTSTVIEPGDKPSTEPEERDGARGPLWKFRQ